MCAYIYTHTYYRPKGAGMLWEIQPAGLQKWRVSAMYTLTPRTSQMRSYSEVD